jgi:hypothetical protein
MRYPVLRFRKNEKTFYAYAHEKEFNKADLKLTLNGVFNNTNVIDSDGKLYLIKGAKKKDWATPLWGYSLLIKGRQIVVKFLIEQVGELSLSDFKKIILDNIKLNLNYYRVYAGGPEYFIKTINEANTFPEIINLFK